LEVVTGMDFDETTQQAANKLRQRLDGLLQVREKVQESRTQVRSADGMITVVVDGRGELSSITFGNAKWRRMPPAELAAALVQTINKARVESRDELMRAYSPFLPRTLDLSGSRDHPANLDQMFDDAMRRAKELLAGGEPGPAARRPSVRQSEGKGS
jgi:DNA-binding protein YbaB